MATDRYRSTPVDIYVTTCRRTAKCNYCGQNVHNGEPIVRGRTWYKFKDKQLEVRQWIRTFRWHARRESDGQCCWLAQAIEELGKSKYVEHRGRKPILLSPEARAVRLRLLQRRARVMQQLRVEAEKSPEVRDIERIIRLGGQLEDLRVQILPLGGVPKSWG